MAIRKDLMIKSFGNFKKSITQRIRIKPSKTSVAAYEKYKGGGSYY
jgi:hypothetical protein